MNQTYSSFTTQPWRLKLTSGAGDHTCVPCVSSGGPPPITSENYHSHKLTPAMSFLPFRTGDPELFRRSNLELTRDPCSCAPSATPTWKVKPKAVSIRLSVPDSPARTLFPKGRRTALHALAPALGVTKDTAIVTPSGHFFRSGPVTPPHGSLPKRAVHFMSTPNK